MGVSCFGETKQAISHSSKLRQVTNIDMHSYASLCSCDVKSVNAGC